MRQDRALKSRKLRSGLEPKLIIQLRTRPPEHVQRLRLPARPVQRQHELLT
jgi:hypothetical protein